jgi:hypothetical protein
MRTLPLVAVSKTHERLHCHERGQNALMQVKGPSLTNEHSDSGFTKMSDGVTAITARDYVTPLKSPVVIRAERHGAPWRVRVRFRRRRTVMSFRRPVQLVGDLLPINAGLFAFGQADHGKARSASAIGFQAGWGG